MKYAEDFRTLARNALSGKWTMAVIAGMIASLLGGVSSGGLEINLDFTNPGTHGGLNIFDHHIFVNGGWNHHFNGLLVAGVSFVLLVGLVMTAFGLFLGSVVGVGYGKFNLDLVDRRQETEIGTLFGYFRHWQTIVVARLLQLLYIFLWSLLFIIPGIVASYSYAMTSYILAENPELTASEAIERSKQMMSGNRWRLFCLRFSFIGWDLLCVLSLGLGELWLRPYKQAAEAAFYREISGTGQPAQPDAAAQA